MHCRNLSIYFRLKVVNIPQNFEVDVSVYYAVHRLYDINLKKYLNFILNDDSL